MKSIPLPKALMLGFILKRDEAFASYHGLYLPLEISKPFALISKNGDINLFLCEEYTLKYHPPDSGSRIDNKLLSRTRSDAVKCFYPTASLNRLVGRGYFHLEAVKDGDVTYYKMLPINDEKLKSYPRK